MSASAALRPATQPRPHRNGLPLWVNDAYVHTCCAAHWMTPLPLNAAPIRTGGAR